MAEKANLLTAEEIETLQSFDDGVSGYFYKMFAYLMDIVNTGIEESRFTEEEARQDVEIALWYSFAANNIDTYEYYYRTVSWMSSSEDGAKGCATWYYRYSVALMYCGRPEEALRYAELGASEEPDYPWVWLQVAKLRSFFGRKEAALDAVKHGLSLVPGDYEFLTLQKEIEDGCTLEEMEYHWIDPDCDQILQQGLDKDADDKQRSIAGIVVDEEGLAKFKALFQPQEWETDWPYCSFFTVGRGRAVSYVFRMNQAALSKMDRDWLQLQKEKIETGKYDIYKGEDGIAHPLASVIIDLDYTVTLFYENGEDEPIQVPIENAGRAFKCK